MIGKLVELVGALCSRSTWRSFSKAEIRQELLAIVRAAAETLLAIESTERAQAALDGPGAPMAYTLRVLGAPGAVAAEVCDVFVCLAVFCCCAHIRRQLGRDAAQRCAFCESQTCRIRYRVQGGPGSRCGCAGKLACVTESAWHVVPPRVPCAYILYGLRAGRSWVHFRPR
jgi:hypothetical protein